MTVREAVHELERMAQGLKQAYPGSFKRVEGSTDYYPRFAWEVRLAGGVHTLEMAAEKLRSTLAEALEGEGP